MRFMFSVAGVAVVLGGITLAQMPTAKLSYQSASEYVNVTVVPPVTQEVLPAPLAPIPKETTLLFGGDVMLSRGINNVMSKHNDFAYPFRQLQELTTKADIAVVNLEGPISSRGKNHGSIYSFRADPKAIEGLTFAGIDLVTLANNHTGDYGPEALSETLEILQEAGIAAVGAGTDMASAKAAHFLTVNGLKFAFLGATPLSPSWLTRQNSIPAVAPFDEQAIIGEIIEARKQGADVVVVLLHWGNEYATKHLPSQEETAHHFIDAGAALVIGHHPHVVQEVEKYNGGVIAYSLGNFVFDQNFSADTRHGLLLKIIFKEKEIAGVQEIPIQFSDSYQPSIMASTTRQE